MNPNAHPTSNTPFLSRREAIRSLGLAGAGLFFGARILHAEPDSQPIPLLTGTQPGYYRFRVGDLEAVVLNDGGFAMPTAESPFGVGEELEPKRAALSGAYLSPDEIRMTINNLLIKIGGELILVDAGAGSVFGAAGGRLLSNLAAIGVPPAAITGILVTHMHGDHFGGLLDSEDRPVFPNAKLFIHRREHEFWSGSEADSLDAGSLAGARKFLNAFDGKWEKITGGDRLVEGLEIVETFGHTPGHISIRIESGNEQLFHMVDVMHHHALSFAHPEWKIAWDVEKENAIATRKRFLAQTAEARTRVLGTHMPFPSLGRVRKSGDAWEYLIEPWMSS
jgi:glyoxylase-like metal-dependent hydrolase (beta-lactamase superfamily II)